MTANAKAMRETARSGDKLTVAEVRADLTCANKDAGETPDLADLRHARTCEPTTGQARPPARSRQAIRRG